MNRRFALLLLFLGTMFIPKPVWADVALPGDRWIPHFPWEESRQDRRMREKMEHLRRETFVPANRIVSLLVEIDNKAECSRLIVPRKLAAGLLPKEGTRSSANIGADKVPTMATGVCLSLAFVFTGLRLKQIRGMMKTHQLGLLAAVALLALGGSLLLANSPPVEQGARTAQPNAAAGHRVIVEIAEGGDSIKLVVHPAVLPGLTRVDGISGQPQGR